MIHLQNKMDEFTTFAAKYTYMNPILLQTPRLLLKGFSPEDMNVIFTTLPKEEIMTLLGHQSDEEFEKEAEKQQQGYASYNRRFMLFLLIDPPSGKVIGRCGLHNWNPDHRRAEIGYAMSDETFKRRGLMSEAVEAIMRYGFTEMNLNRIEAIVAPDNEPSLKIIRKNNFQEEGRLRKHYPAENGFEDSLVFGVLFDEYDAGIPYS